MIDLETILAKAEHFVDGVLDYMPVVSTMRLKRERHHALDTLTELPAVGFFTEKFARILNDYVKNGTYFEIVVTDTAGMKYANDVLRNESVGDGLLKTTAGILAKMPITRRDAVGRWGGDEFAYVFSGNKQFVREKVKATLDNIYQSQLGINERGISGLGGMELCIGVGVVTPDDIPLEYLPKPGKAIPKNDVPKLIMYLLRTVGDKRAGQDKERQGIYNADRHPEYNRNPERVNEINLITASNPSEEPGLSR